MSQDRWSRQILIPGFGDEGQHSLSKSQVAVLGLGGVGGPAVLYLAAAGVGSLILADRVLWRSVTLTARYSSA